MIKRVCLYIYIELCAVLRCYTAEIIENISYKNILVVGNFFISLAL